MAHLTRSVSAGGVVYPAGTPATPALRKIIKARFWSSEETVSESAQSAVPALRKSIRELTTKVAELTAENEALRAQVQQGEPGTDGGSAAGSGVDNQPDRYDGWRIDRLRNEAAAREIQVDDPSDKQGILAALRAADAAAETGD